MATGLDVAASAFAIVGAADVAVRTGREVYAFLCEVVDAPKNIDRLSNTIQEITLLVESTQQCLKALDARRSSNSTYPSLKVATKSIDRELQALKKNRSRYKGKSKTWSSVKYVLDERTIKNALRNLEQAKLMLGDFLVLACRELSALDHGDTQELIQQCYEQLGMKTDRLSQTISSTSSQLERRVTNEHETTREVLVQRFDNISAKLDELRTPVANHTPLQSDRTVYFYGERPDMIMAYLLIAKGQLESMFGRLIAADEDISLEQFAWLQAEFEHLVASAAQQEAVRHSGSTASSFDEWHYLDHSRDTEEIYSAMDTSQVGKAQEHSQMIRPESPQLGKKKAQHILQKTPFGNMCVQLPQQSARNAPRDQEAGFTFSCGIGASVNFINASFRKTAFSPRVCAQLNVFTLVPSEQSYDLLFRNASIPEIDQALREGAISPYHVNREGRNMCLYYAAEHTRTDLFDYLDRQGIGVSNLNHDISVVAGLFRRSMTNTDRKKLEALTDSVLERVSDTTTFLFETTMNMLLYDYYQRRPRSILKRHLHRLRKEGMLRTSQLVNIIDNTEHDDVPWDWAAAHSLMTALTTCGVQVDTIGSNGRNRIQRAFVILQWAEKPGDPQAVIEASNALIKIGIDIHHPDNEGLTSSMYARRYGHWDEWCTALELNDLNVRDVLRKEDALWLLGEDWRKIWVEKFGPL